MTVLDLGGNMPAMVLFDVGPPPAEPAWDLVLVVAAILFLFWALVLRPEARVASRRKAWLLSLTSGAEVRLTTGVSGRIVSMSPDQAEVVIDLGDGVQVPVRPDWIVGPPADVRL